MFTNAILYIIDARVLYFTSGMADAARDLLMAAHMLWDKLWINPSYEKWERLTNDHDLERLQKEHIPSGSEDFHSFATSACPH
jgi:hypothetical protein